MITADSLVKRALFAATRAYAPYSNYKVGAAVLADDGTVVDGCNVENASYPGCVCAEQVALSSAIAQGKRNLVAIAIATPNGAMPCGICRQIILELGPKMEVHISDGKGGFITSNIQELLPNPFNSQSLKVDILKPEGG